MELLSLIIVLNQVMNQTGRKKIVLVDDNVLCIEALKLLINKESGFQIIDEISTLTGLESYNNLHRIDLFLLNAGLPFEKIIPITVFLKKATPEIPAILFNARKPDQLVLQCVMNGIRGIVWLSDTTSRLFFVFHKVLNGERYLGVNESEIHKLKIAGNQLEKISDRELTVLKLFALGNSYRQIADALNISPRTVESHKNNILTKLELGSLKELIAYSIKNNII